MQRVFEVTTPLPARGSATALRQQLVEHLLRNRPNVGDRFLSDHELARITRLSRPTVRRALDDLQRDGWIERSAAGTKESAKDGAGAKEKAPPGLGRFNVAPTQEILVVRSSPDPEEAKAGEREAKLMRWGLVPVLGGRHHRRGRGGRGGGRWVRGRAGNFRCGILRGGC